MLATSPSAVSFSVISTRSILVPFAVLTSVIGLEQSTRDSCEFFLSSPSLGLLGESSLIQSRQFSRLSFIDNGLDHSIEAAARNNETIRNDTLGSQQNFTESSEGEKLMGKRSLLFGSAAQDDDVALAMQQNNHAAAEPEEALPRQPENVSFESSGASSSAPEQATEEALNVRLRNLIERAATWSEQAKSWSSEAFSTWRGAADEAYNSLFGAQSGPSTKRPRRGIRPSLIIFLILIVTCMTGICLCFEKPKPQPSLRRPTSDARLMFDGASPDGSPRFRRIEIPVREEVASGGDIAGTTSGGFPTFTPSDYAAAREDQRKRQDFAEAGVKTAPDDFFCADLSVPEQCECMLVVPVFAPEGTFPICDVQGQAVLQATKQPGTRFQLALEDIKGNTLALCNEVESSSTNDGEDSGQEYHVSDAKGKFFGSISSCGKNFELVTTTGFRLQFWGNFETQAINVTDYRTELLATTEPCERDGEIGAYYTLRVAPLANVAQALCGLLCIGHMRRTCSSLPSHP